MPDRKVLIVAWVLTAGCAHTSEPAPRTTLLNASGVAAAMEEGAQMEPCWQLADAARTADDLVQRGEAIVALANSEMECGSATLAHLQLDASQPEIVRAWAEAGWALRIHDPDELAAHSVSRPSSPAALEALFARFADLARAPVAQYWIEVAMLSGTMQQPARQRAVNRPMAELMAVTLQGPTDSIRRGALTLVGLRLAADPDEQEVVGAALAYDPSATALPWSGGKLHLPRIQWAPEEGWGLARALLSWQLHCMERGDQACEAEASTWRRSLPLDVPRGSRPNPEDTEEALWWYGVYRGEEALRSLLEEQGLADDPRWPRKEGTP